MGFLSVLTCPRKWESDNAKFAILDSNAKNVVHAEVGGDSGRLACQGVSSAVNIKASDGDSSFGKLECGSEAVLGLVALCGQPESRRCGKPYRIQVTTFLQRFDVLIVDNKPEFSEMTHSSATFGTQSMQRKIRNRACVGSSAIANKFSAWQSSRRARNSLIVCPIRSLRP